MSGRGEEAIKRGNDFFRSFFFVPRGEIALFREMRLYRMIS